MGGNLGSNSPGVTFLHYDHSHNIYGQLSGSKKFTLVPPYRRDKLAPFFNPGGIIESHTRQKYTRVRDAPLKPHRIIRFDLDNG